MSDVANQDAKAQEELARARQLEEGFTPVEPREGEEPEQVEISADELNRCQETIKTMAQKQIETDALLRRYKAMFGELED